MIDEQPESRHGAPFILFALLHLVRCGIPVLVLSGVSLAFLAPSWPLIGAALFIDGGMMLYPAFREEG